MKSKNYLWIILLILIIVVASIFILIFNNNAPSQNSENLVNTESKNTTENNTSENTQESKASTPPETENEIASVTTNLSFSSEGRLTNIEITESKLNGVEVLPGEEFSFNKKTGPSLAEEGYEDAPVIIDGKTVQAIGGGNCQVSSTLYNAVLSVDGLEVTERHPHGKDVGYVPEGKDATISYGSLDFKFVNNLDKKIRLYFSNDDETMTSRIVTVE